MNQFLRTIESYLGSFVIDIFKALVVLIIGLWIIGKVVRLLRKMLDPVKIDPTLKPFLVSVTNIGLKVLLIIGVVQLAGYPATSFVAVLGAASLAIGLAFQGSLSNLAGGVLLLSLRPFHVGDYIEISGEEGFVEAIHVFNTILVTHDNRVISVPNGAVAGSTIINHTLKETRRVDMIFGVAYESDLKLVKRLLEEVVNNHPLVLKDPAPFVRLGNQGDSSLDFTVRAWCKTEDYLGLPFDITEQVTDAFNSNGVSIPYPQMDIHLER